MEVIVLYSGILIAVQRFRDPLTLNKFKFIINCCKKQDKKETQRAMNESNLNTFLKTSLNTELVVTILKGITILAAGSSDITDNMKE